MTEFDLSDPQTKNPSGVEQLQPVDKAIPTPGLTPRPVGSLPVNGRIRETEQQILGAKDSPVTQQPPSINGYAPANDSTRPEVAPPPPTPLQLQQALQTQWLLVKQWLSLLVTDTETCKQLTEKIGSFPSLPLPEQHEIASTIANLSESAGRLQNAKTLFSNVQKRTQIETAFAVIHGPTAGKRYFREITDLIQQQIPISGSSVGESLDRLRQTIYLFSHPEKMTVLQRTRLMAGTEHQLNNALKEVTKWNEQLQEKLNRENPKATRYPDAARAELQKIQSAYDSAKKHIDAFKTSGKGYQSIQQEIKNLTTQLRAHAKTVETRLKNEQFDAHSKLHSVMEQATKTYSANVQEYLKPQVQKLNELRDAYRKRPTPETLTEYGRKVGELWTGYSAVVNQETVAAHQSVERLEILAGVTRFVRDGSLAVGAALVPGAQGASVLSAGAALASLGALKTTLSLLDSEGSVSRGHRGLLRQFAIDQGTTFLSAAGGAMSSLNALKLGAGAYGVLGAGARQAGVNVALDTTTRLLDGQEITKGGVVGAAVGGLVTPGIARAAAVRLPDNRGIQVASDMVASTATAAGIQVVTNAGDGRDLTSGVLLTAVTNAAMAAASGAMAAGNPLRRLNPSGSHTALDIQRNNIRQNGYSEDPHLIVRNSQAFPRQDYLLASHNALRYFDEAFWRDSRSFTPQSFTEMNAEMHQLSNYNNSFGQPHSAEPGALRPAECYNFRWLAHDYTNMVLKHFNLNPAPIKESTAGGLVQIRGIPTEHLPLNFRYMDLVGHAYPHGSSLPHYYKEGAKILSKIKGKLQAGNSGPEVWGQIGDYYHLMVNARPYDQINNSLFMNQANYLLRLSGHPGISHHWIDHIFTRIPQETARLLWPKILNKEVPKPEFFGITID